MLLDISLRNNQYGKAIFIIFFLKNNSLNKLLNKITSYKFDINNKPNLSDFQKFGYVAYHYKKDPKCTNVNNQGIKCIFFK